MTQLTKAINQIGIDIAIIRTRIIAIDKHLEQQNSSISKHKEELKIINKFVNTYKGEKKAIIAISGSILIIAGFLIK